MSQYRMLRVVDLSVRGHVGVHVSTCDPVDSPNHEWPAVIIDSERRLWGFAEPGVTKLWQIGEAAEEYDDEHDNLLAGIKFVILYDITNSEQCLAVARLVQGPVVYPVQASFTPADEMTAAPSS